MDTIVCAYDGSECSRKASHVAAELAKRYDAKLTLVFVVIPFSPPLDLPGAAYANWVEPMRKAGLELVQERASTLATSDGIHPETAVLEGDPAEEIVRFASGLNAPFIVCGSRGLGAVKRLLLGSVAQKLVHLATTPIVVVH